jgi:hypothetical protein
MFLNLSRKNDDKPIPSGNGESHDFIGLPVKVIAEKKYMILQSLHVSEGKKKL